jgi:hypothetical protein
LVYQDPLGLIVGCFADNNFCRPTLALPPSHYGGGQSCAFTINGLCDSRWVFSIGDTSPLDRVRPRRFSFSKTTVASPSSCAAALAVTGKNEAAVTRAESAWPILTKAGAAHRVAPSLLAAIGVRETGFLNVHETGGTGVGYGVFQLTVTSKTGVTAEQAGDLPWAATYAANMLHTNMIALGRSFPQFNPAQLLQATAASYNFGVGNIHGDPDKIDEKTASRNSRESECAGEQQESDQWNAVRQRWNTNHDGSLNAGERQRARVIIYGHSWGGSEAISLARALEADDIPVLLTIQVDSVAKRHRNDSMIPANLANAANFYQTSGRLHGQPEIHADDSTRTNIIGNFRFDYKAVPYTCDKYPWYDRVFSKAHTQIECDPTVWQKVEQLIRSNLPSTVGRRRSDKGLIRSCLQASISVSASEVQALISK